MHPDVPAQIDAGPGGAVVRVTTATLGVGFSSAALIAFGTQHRDVGVVLAFLGGVFSVVATAGALLDAERRPT